MYLNTKLEEDSFSSLIKNFRIKKIVNRIDNEAYRKIGKPLKSMRDSFRNIYKLD